jgi:hypothetical protein
MIVQTLTLIICAVVGYIFGGMLGAAALLALWAGVLFSCGYLRARRKPAADGTGSREKVSVYADIDAVNDRLEEVARERRWGLEKRLEIARIACENPSVPFEELESLYERGFRAAPDIVKEAELKKRSMNKEPCWRTLH